MSRIVVTPNDSLKETLDRVKQTIVSKGGTLRVIPNKVNLQA